MSSAALSEQTIASTAHLRSASGMRPTGPLHLGHYFGVLKNWVAMQHELQCFFFVADWHALTSEYEQPQQIREFVPNLIRDWVASGLDPEHCVLFQQSKVEEHAKLSLILSMITPLGWLERCPTYKEQQQNIAGKDLQTHGFLGYPVLMTADIILYRPKWVPVGQDQLPHLELSREIARRFNHLYGNFFPEPEARLTPAAKCPGLDGRKMSKSYHNSIYLHEPMESIAPKVKGMLTDVNRLRRTDSGNPDVCNLFPYHILLASEAEQQQIRKDCTSAGMGCVDCKKIFMTNLTAFLEPFHERRAQLSDRRIQEILEHGNERARDFAQQTMQGVLERIGF